MHTILLQNYDGKLTSATRRDEVFRDAAISQRIGMALEGSAISRPSTENPGDRK